MTSRGQEGNTTRGPATSLERKSGRNKSPGPPVVMTRNPVAAPLQWVRREHNRESRDESESTWLSTPVPVRAAVEVLAGRRGSEGGWCEQSCDNWPAFRAGPSGTLGPFFATKPLGQAHRLSLDSVRRLVRHTTTATLSGRSPTGIERNSGSRCKDAQKRILRVQAKTH